MQRICAVRGGAAAYVRDPDVLLTDESRRCPFCADGHRLWLHGWYERWVILGDGQGSVRIAVRRLRCARVGRTVSLLPDFCLPGRQHGAGVVGRFLVYHVLEGCSLVAALDRARGGAGAHSVAQALRDGFRSRAGRLWTYLAGKEAADAGGPLRTLVCWLKRGFDDAAEAFRHHGREFHCRQGVGLA
jgi:hypothetical protein